MFESPPFSMNTTNFGIQVAANRNATLADAVKVTWNRGGWKGFYQGLIPWVGNNLYMNLLWSTNYSIGSIGLA
jgi:hypothetical protein